MEGLSEDVDIEQRGITLALSARRRQGQPYPTPGRPLFHVKHPSYLQDNISSSSGAPTVLAAEPMRSA